MARTKAPLALTNPSFEDLVDALNSLARYRGGEPYRAVRFVLPVQPMPAPRPKFTHDGYAYSPKPYVTWRGNVAPHIPKLEPTITGVRCAVALGLVLPPYKTVATPWPKGDVDNFEKSVYDIVTKRGHIWKDDVQICLNITLKRFSEDGESPHAEVYIREWSA